MCFEKCVIEETSANSRIKNINLRNVEIQDNTGIVKYLSEKKNYNQTEIFRNWFEKKIKLKTVWELEGLEV